jgi:hypothetical protein
MFRSLHGLSWKVKESFPVGLDSCSHRIACSMLQLIVHGCSLFQKRLFFRESHCLLKLP